MNTPAIVSPQEWEAARLEMRAKEKQLMRARDALAAERRTNYFIRDGDHVFRTYFTNGRGDEANASTWSYLDHTALGRQDSPEGYPQTPPYAWWKWHDAYDREASPEHLEQIDRALNSGARAT